MSECYLTVLLHPSAIVRGRWELEPPQEAYLRRITRDPTPTLTDITQPPPNSKLYPTLEDLDAFYLEAQHMGTVACDVEACGPWPICVGLTALNLETSQIGSSVCLRIRVMGGGRYWTAWSEHVRATRWLYHLLANPAIAKAFHNGVGFDIPEFEALGFEVAGEILDTLVMAHSQYSELPKGLQFLSTLFLGMPHWKSLIDEDEEGKE